jgi:hypothetical protein
VTRDRRVSLHFATRFIVGDAFHHGAGGQWRFNSRYLNRDGLFICPSSSSTLAIAFRLAVWAFYLLFQLINARYRVPPSGTSYPPAFRALCAIALVCEFTPPDSDSATTRPNEARGRANSPLDHHRRPAFPRPPLVRRWPLVDSCSIRILDALRSRIARTGPQSPGNESHKLPRSIGPNRYHRNCCIPR